jgi:putative hemolysin
MSALLSPAQVADQTGLVVELASTNRDILAAKRLRYSVFAKELGARLDSADKGIDEDRFDAYCHHLLVRERDGGRIVATTRLLLDEQARAAGGFYSESEFSMPSILALYGRRLEIGRTCVAPHHRHGAAITALWSGLGAFINRHHIDYLFGCASIDLSDGGVRASAVIERLRQKAMLPPADQATPRLRIPEVSAHDRKTVKAPLPPLLKAYIRLGARVAGEPCHDPAFNVADVLVLVSVASMDHTYARHFLRRTPRVDPR